MPVLEQRVSLAGHSLSVSGEGDDSDHPFQDLVRQEGVSLHPLQDLHAVEGKKKTS